jgi:hypothetical protein
VANPETAVRSRESGQGDRVWGSSSPEGSEQSVRDRWHPGTRWNLEPREAATLAAILIVTAAVYLPSLRNGWVWDDWVAIVGCDRLHSWSGIAKSFIYDSWWWRDPKHLPQSVYYRPLQATWFALNWMILGNHPVLWHLEKIALELIAVVLSFRVTQLLTRSTTIALLTAALFGLLPGNTESVVWAAAIGEPLSTALELGALCYLINRKPGRPRGLIMALTLYAGAMLSHETAILFPAIIALYVFLFEAGDERSDGEARTLATTRRIGLALRVSAPFVLVAIAYMCARVYALGFNSLFGVHFNFGGTMIVRGFIAAPPHYTPAQVLMTLPMVLITYLAVLALPAMAGPTHAVPWITHLQPLPSIYAAGLVLLGAIAFVLAWRSPYRRIYMFCAAWSLLTMAPALNLNNLFYLVDDRYLYAPSFGWSLAVAVAVLQIAAIGSRARKAVGVAMAVLLVAYMASMMKTERYWHDNISFFEREVEIAPYDWGFRSNLATAMNSAGDLEGAARQLERGTALAPNDAPLRLKLAKQYKRMGRELDFEREFEKFNELSSALVERRDAEQAADQSNPAAGP